VPLAGTRLEHFAICGGNQARIFVLRNNAALRSPGRVRSGSWRRSVRLRQPLGSGATTTIFVKGKNQ